MCNYAADNQAEALRERDLHIARLRAEIDELTCRNNQYTRLLAIAVQRLGGNMVIVDDEPEMPVLTIFGNVVTTRPVVREYPVVAAKHIGMSDE